jgi:hypothetical protein
VRSFWIPEKGEFTGVIREYDRYGLFFVDAIGYDAAQTWLLEDEYEPIEGRLSVSEIK